MFSVREKREIADAVQKILRATNHPELPKGEINFVLHVQGGFSWSWADIRNNGAVTEPEVNPWNEKQDPANCYRTGKPLHAVCSHVGTERNCWTCVHARRHEYTEICAGQHGCFDQPAARCVVVDNTPAHGPQEEHHG